MLLKEKNALITGAARGIGNAMLHVFAREGANVWAFARKPDEAFERDCALTAVAKRLHKTRRLRRCRTSLLIAQVR